MDGWGDLHGISCVHEYRTGYGIVVWVCTGRSLPRSYTGSALEIRRSQTIPLPGPVRVSSSASGWPATARQLPDHKQDLVLPDAVTAVYLMMHPEILGNLTQTGIEPLIKE